MYTHFIINRIVNIAGRPELFHLRQAGGKENIFF